MEASEKFKDVTVYSGEPQVAEVLPGPVAMLPMVQTKTQYHTAVTVQKPRDLDKLVAAVKREAALAGEAFYWSWPVKNKKTGRTETLDGPSIGLAMCVAREWTNVAVEVEYTETATHDIFTAHFVDLERGFTVSRIWKQSKGANKDLSAWGERAVNMTFQAAQSRAIRNAVLAGVPKWLVDQAKEIAKESVLKGITPEKIAAAREQSIKVFGARGVTEARLVAALRVPVTQWGPGEIVALKGMLNQIKDGQASADELFPVIEEKTEPVSDKKKAPPKAKGPVKGITDETQAQVISEAQAKGLDLVNLLQGIPIEELTEEDGQKALAAIRELKGKDLEPPADPPAGEGEAFQW
jgi:hypothetical protein